MVINAHIKPGRVTRLRREQVEMAVSRGWPEGQRTVERSPTGHIKKTFKGFAARILLRTLTRASGPA